MRGFALNNIKHLPLIVLITGVLATGWWVIYNPWTELTVSLPGADNFIAGGATEAENIIIGEHFENLATAEFSSGETWPSFRGEFHDNIYMGKQPLINNFSQGGTEILWSAEFGEGHAGPAIYDGMVYLLDYDEEMRADMLRVFALESGEELWRRWYNVHIRRNHGMSRTVPAVTKEYILTIGPRGHVMCLDRLSGDLLWSIDLEQEWGTEIPLWYTGQCPLIDNGIAIIAPGGDALMIGVDCATGEILWETPNPDGWEMSHASVMPFDFGGQRMYVYSAVGGAIGVAADGPGAGSVLWRVPEWNHRVLAASPVCIPDGRIFFTAGYGAGSMMIRLHESNGDFDVEILETFSPGVGLSSEQQTPVYADGHLFGVLPKDGRANRNQFVCVNPDEITSFEWTSGSTARFGLGPFILADDKFYLLDDDGTLYIIEKSTREFRLLDSMELIEDGHDAWAPLALADGYLLLRDSHTMICININR